MAQFTTHSLDNFKRGLRNFYMRSIGVLNYVPSYQKIKSKVILYRPTEVFMRPDAENDYGLSEMVEEPVEVNFFEGGHTTVLKNTTLSDAINKLFV